MSYADAVLADSPAGYWRLNETTGTSIADSAGSNGGTIVGGVTLNQGALDADATANSALFDGATGDIQLSAITGLPRTLPLTIEGIIDITELPPGGQFSHARIASLGHYPDGGWAFGMDTSGDLIFTAFTLADHITGVEFPPYGTHHIAVSITSLGSAAFYLDGSLVDTITGVSLVDPGGSDDGHVGAASFSEDISDPWNGGLAEVAVYSTALTGAQIAAHVAAMHTVDGSASLSGSGSLSVTAVRVRGGSVSLGGSGSFSPTATRVRGASVALVASGSMSALAAAIRGGRVSMSGTGHFTVVIPTALAQVLLALSDEPAMLFALSDDPVLTFTLENL